MWVGWSCRDKVPETRNLGILIHKAHIGYCNSAAIMSVLYNKYITASILETFVAATGVQPRKSENVCLLILCLRAYMEDLL